jgi:RHS repeat-associated protein
MFNKKSDEGTVALKYESYWQCVLRYGLPFAGGRVAQTVVSSGLRSPEGTGLEGPAGTESESDWYPFGGERVISDTLTNPNHYKFTGMERDTETGLDHTLFRQFTSVYGRWYSPDRMVGNVLNPQTWNRYAYVTNNPATMTDPFGLSGNCATAYAGCPTNVPDANQTAQAEIANYQASVNVNQENLTPESPDMASGEQAVTEESGQAFMNNCTNCDKSSTYTVDGTTYTYQTADVSTKLTAGTNNAAIATGDTQTGEWVSLSPADTQVGMDIWHSGPQCPGCGEIWNSANTWAVGAEIGTGALVSAPFALGLPAAVSGGYDVLLGWTMAHPGVVLGAMDVMNVLSPVPYAPATAAGMIVVDYRVGEWAYNKIKGGN